MTLSLVQCEKIIVSNCSVQGSDNIVNICRFSGVNNSATFVEIFFSFLVFSSKNFYRYFLNSFLYNTIILYVLIKLYFLVMAYGHYWWSYLRFLYIVGKKRRFFAQNSDNVEMAFLWRMRYGKRKL